ncbi:hypothetical protein BSKO_09528 [Bryopsis sp. KO-2023]|nr:hypothetical protein BSKO_09528 [Bryopsis sp. KO-2023]
METVSSEKGSVAVYELGNRSRCCGGRGLVSREGVRRRVSASHANGTISSTLRCEQLSGRGSRHVCRVASSDPRDFALNPILNPEVLGLGTPEEDSGSSDGMAILSKSFDERNDALETDIQVSSNEKETVSEAEEGWSQKKSILWTVWEARNIISRYSYLDLGQLGAGTARIGPLGLSLKENLAVPPETEAIKNVGDVDRMGDSGILTLGLEGEAVGQLDGGAVMTAAISASVDSMDSGVSAMEDSNVSFLDEAKVGLPALVLCSLCYLHCSATGFALPTLLPIIGNDIDVTDAQGALLTTGYTMLYALALIPMGLLADRVDRPKLLAGGALLWSGLNSMISGAGTFKELMMLRVGFAAAQATQNPICMSMLPELFPKNKSTAMAIYNCAIYVGRALSYGFVMILAGLGVSDTAGVKMVPLDKLDLDIMSVLYTTGDSAAVLPVYDYNMQVIFSQLEVVGWRDLVYWLSVPGVVIAMALMLLVREPRDGCPEASKNDRVQQKESGSSDFRVEVSGDGTAAVSIDEVKKEGGALDDVRKLVKSPSFQATTFAAAMNDVGGWGLIAWQALFYERVFEMPSSAYAPLLAGIIPLGGIVGGVGGGLAADWLSERGNRYMLTFGASLLSAPLIYLSLQAETPNESFWYLLFGFALSECWRAPAAVMAREVAPKSMGSTASAVHLCIRNILAGLGPIGVAALAEPFGLRNAMTLIPFSYLVSALGFLVAEVLIKVENAQSENGP